MFDSMIQVVYTNDIAFQLIYTEYSLSLSISFVLSETSVFFVIRKIDSSRIFELICCAM